MDNGFLKMLVHYFYSCENQSDFERDKIFFLDRPWIIE